MHDPDATHDPDAKLSEATPSDSTLSVPELTRLAAREAVLRLLALAASDPASARFEKATGPALLELASAAARYLAADPEARPAALAPGETSPETFDLEPLALALCAPRAELVGDHDRVFGLVISKVCPPLETQYCPETFSIYRSQRIADVAGFYNAFGVEPGRDAPERADHLACELEFLAWLAAKERWARGREGASWSERAETCRDAQRVFFAEHVAWWIPAFARALETRASSLAPPAPLHAALAAALAAWVPLERALLDVEPPTELVRPREDAGESADACAGCGAEEIAALTSAAPGPRAE